MRGFFSQRSVRCGMAVMACAIERIERACGRGHQGRRLDVIVLERADNRESGRPISRENSASERNRCRRIDCRGCRSGAHSNRNAATRKDFLQAVGGQHDPSIFARYRSYRLVQNAAECNECVSAIRRQFCSDGDRLRRHKDASGMRTGFNDINKLWQRRCRHAHGSCRRRHRRCDRCWRKCRMRGNRCRCRCYWSSD